MGRLYRIHLEELLMKKNLFLLSLLSLMISMPSLSMAANNWDGEAADGVWANPVNWTGDILPDNEWNTEEARYDSSYDAVIAEGNNTEWDHGRIKDSTLTQTGGTHRWLNWT
jgi:hypothetical protein